MNIGNHLNGYVVGDNGILLKSSATSLNSNGFLTGTTWVQKAIADNLNVTTYANVDINAIAFASRYNGVWGGTYNFTNTTQYPYVRLIRDESELFSTYFFYDKLGRIVVSQNTKQYNGSGSSSGSSRYSYTLYDELGRVKQAGEKSENTNAATPFISVFGTTIANHYNPKVIDDGKLNLWLTDNSGARKEVTQSYYDKTVIAGLPVDFLPNTETQRKRITHVTYEDIFDNDNSTFDHATHYDYDIHGNVKTLLQDNKKLASTYSADADIVAQRFKRMDYNYDLISGNVHSVSYQKGEVDAWHHAYEYDADNRITNVFTSNAANTVTGIEAADNTGSIINDVMDNHLWDNDAKYEYYQHGPLARMETGDNQVQGTDYVYTLQGWIKGVNSSTLNANNDPGADSKAATVNALFARDVYGYSLNYFNVDYQSIEANNNIIANSFTASITGSDVEANRFDLFNGNIGSMITTITNPTTREILPLGNAYKYDQLNRLLQAVSYSDLDITDDNNGNYNEFGTGTAQMYFNDFIYDANGNITHQTRKDHNGALIDNMEYKYAEGANGKVQNRLYHVIEDQSIPSNLYTDDMEDQGTFDPTLNTINQNNNYGFDEMGNLIRDDKEGIEEIKWRVDGKIAEIDMTAASGKPDLKFDYNVMGLRIAKHVIDQSGILQKTEYYSHDLTGNIIAVYLYKPDDNTPQHLASYKLSEFDIYSPGKMGVVKSDLEMIGAIVNSDEYNHELGKKNYFFSNHLGNIITTTSDKKIPVESTITTGEVEYNIAEIVTAVDYSPFGVELYDRRFSVAATAYGFNGQRKDNEIYGEGNSYTTEFRQLDTRLGRWLSLDLLKGKFPFYSPYISMNNSPISIMDPKGLEGENSKSIKESASMIPESEVKTQTLALINKLEENGVLDQTNLTIEFAETQVPNFDENGNLTSVSTIITGSVTASFNGNTVTMNYDGQKWSTHEKINNSGSITATTGNPENFMNLTIEGLSGAYDGLTQWLTDAVKIVKEYENEIGTTNIVTGLFQQAAVDHDAKAANKATGLKSGMPGYADELTAPKFYKIMGWLGTIGTSLDVSKDMWDTFNHIMQKDWSNAAASAMEGTSDIMVHSISGTLLRSGTPQGVVAALVIEVGWAIISEFF